MKLSCDPAILLFGIHLTEMNIYSQKYINVHSSIIYLYPKNGNKYPSTDEGINKMWYMYTTQCYLAIKRNKVLVYATTWIDPGNIVLN